mgnify:CR=1 FL=1
MINGHGIAHPKRMGLATYVGLKTELPTIGCAKEILVGRYNEPENFRGAWRYIYYNGERVGGVVRTKQGTRPVFISPGCFISIEKAVEIVLATAKYRIPEPLRIAHIRSKALCKKSKTLL